MNRNEEARELLGPELMALLERCSLASRETTQDRSGTAGPPQAEQLGVDFYEYSTYQPGIDVRHVDWAVYGRTGSLMVRAYESHQEQPIDVAIDCSASMGVGDAPGLELAVRLAAALAYVGLVTYHPVRLVAFNKERVEALPFRAGRAAVHSVLSFLAGLRAEGETQLAAGITAGLEGVSRRSGRLFLISDFLDPAGLAQAFALLGTTRRRVDLVALVDEQEGLLPTGAVEAVDPETGRSEPLHVSEDVAADYLARLAELRRELARRTHEIEAHLTVLSPATPVDDAVLRLLD